MSGVLKGTLNLALFKAIETRHFCSSTAQLKREGLEEIRPGGKPGTLFMFMLGP